MRELILIRHCQSSGQTPDAPLTEVGLEQAKVLADFLADRSVDLIVSSSYTRAQQSIVPFAASVDLPIRLDERLIERRLSSSPIDDWRQVVRDSFEDLDLRALGGESGREVLSRAWAALNDLLEGDYRLPIAVAHGNLISLILNSLDSNFGYAGWEALSNPDVFLLQKDEQDRLQFERIWS